MDSRKEDNQSETQSTDNKKVPNYPGPISGVKYPLNVLYCGGK